MGLVFCVSEGYCNKRRDGKGYDPTAVQAALCQDV